ncbi:hypothetical protein Psal006b_01750 [Piscirickettsia salmonis]|uniref:Transposase n=1 Tax=Piscirickettsia salmonis TaxID=1238 RepID=A0AAC9EUW8_PISSA|nr:hypothetical protein [Piscirickettsia salmonis]ALB22638.1 transposase [Piscirickettsia salmonis]QGN98755.1 hypothetical protein Psal006b_01750 [Piscirickettsia salmonis]QGO02379.1 hypothetical protein Psal008_01766 [Piscirickettsia salmonis]QGO13058.1 hypothetical protein Psal010b_01747 [Piscirickettsia salmonis]QGO20109.1 hypothetical protein Psal013_01764 [Piscirickettsia salmonis]
MSTEDNNNIPSSNTGPYCKARQKLPIETLESLVKLSGDSLSKSSNARWKIYNREVKLIEREFDITQPFSRLYFMPREGFFSCKQ